MSLRDGTDAQKNSGVIQTFVQRRWVSQTRRRGGTPLETKAHLRKVLLPYTTSDLVATQIECLEIDSFHLKFLGRRELSGLMLGKTRVLQHVHECGFPGVV